MYDSVVLVSGVQSDSLVVIISALYCKLLVVIGLAFPLSEVISSNIPPFYYEVSEV